MRLAAIVSFLDEERLLPTFLAAVSRQTRAPDRIILVDDGSHDGSRAIAERFAQDAPNAEVLALPRRPAGQDRLAGASELRAFQAGVARLDPGFEIIAKLDADLELPRRFFEEIVAEFEADPALGLAGAYLSVRDEDGTTRRERCPPHHVRGANRFYRRECLEQVSPIRPFLGWDTVDETQAKMAGWHVRALELPAGDPIHLRPTGGYDGVALRGFRRIGFAAWGYGAHPLGVLAGAGSRMKDPPRVLGGLAFLFGWLQAAVRRFPRADVKTRAYFRTQQMTRMRQAIRRGVSAPG